MTAKTKLFILFTCFIVSSSRTSGQSLVEITNETLTVNSTSNMTGNTRNKADVKLPENTIKYIYRISVLPKGDATVANSLFDLLQTAGPASVKVASSFAQYAIGNNDNLSVDAFIFNNVYDAEKFYNKESDWGACKSLMNRVSCCFATSDCIGQQVFFGFRNNNIMQGLDVKLEVVALVDTSSASTSKYSYTIENGTGREISYYISLDNVNWKQVSLRDGYQHNPTVEQSTLYFKLVTNTSKSVLYTLRPNERYKIVWNEGTQRWDIVRA
jgi:hypothetical protein